MKLIYKLQNKKYRKTEDTFLVEGWRAVSELINVEIEICNLIINENNYSKQYQNELKILEKKSKKITKLNEIEFKKIAQTENSQGIIAVIKKFKYDFESIIKNQKDKSTIVALDGINDPGNLGTIIRICDWFGIDALLIGEKSCDLYNPKVIRSTVGSIFHLPIIENINLIEAIKKLKNYQIIGADLKSVKSIEKFNFSKKICIIIGSEAHGISKTLLKQIPETIKIPKFGKAESLNAAISLSVILTKKYL